MNDAIYECQISTLRSFLTFIARDLGINDPYGERNPVTVTREIREKIAELKGKSKLEDFSISEWEH